MPNYLNHEYCFVDPFFVPTLKETINHIEKPKGIFSADQPFTFQRNLSFLTDDTFMAAFKATAETPTEKAIIWRIAVLAWAAQHAMYLEGAFVECACYKGTPAKIICDPVNFTSLDRKYYLYDLFKHAARTPSRAQ